jgi:hypothetical protein
MLRLLTHGCDDNTYKLILKVGYGEGMFELDSSGSAQTIVVGSYGYGNEHFCSIKGEECAEEDIWTEEG